MSEKLVPPTQDIGESVLLTIDGPVATVTLNRPEARNGLILGMGAILLARLGTVAADPGVRVVILRGAGRDFCVGADIKAKPREGKQSSQSDFAPYQVSVMLHEMPQVTIAALRGGCAGAGFGYACACDLRVGDDDARINPAFLNAGVAGDMGVPWLLPRLIGAGRARELMFFPRKLGSQEALEMGLLQRVWAGEVFEGKLAEFADRLGRAPPLALMAMKANFHEAERLDFRSFIAIETERNLRLLQSEDRAEAFAAFVEKRQPKFRSR